METRNVKRKTNDRCAPLPKKWGRWICRCVCCQFFFWAVEDQRCGEALELGGHGHRNPPRCHADTRSDLDHDSGIPLQISTEIRTMYPNHVKRWGPHPERCPRLSRQAGQQGILTEPHMEALPLDVNAGLGALVDFKKWEEALALVARMWRPQIYVMGPTRGMSMDAGLGFAWCLLVFYYFR